MSTTTRPTRTEADLQRIREAYAQIDQAEAAGGDGVAEDVAFHRAIARACANPFILATLEYLGQYLVEASRVTRANEARRPGLLDQVRQEHGAIVEAIAAGDAARARRAASAHLHNAVRRIRSADSAFWTEQGVALASGLLTHVRP